MSQTTLPERLTSKQRLKPLQNHQTSSYFENPEIDTKSNQAAFVQPTSLKGYQLYKQCVDQIHYQPSVTLMKSQVRVQPSSSVLRNQSLADVTKDISSQLTISACSIQQGIKTTQNQLKNTQQQRFNILIKIYDSKIQQIQESYKKEILQLQTKFRQLQLSIDSKQSQIQSIKEYYQQQLLKERQNRLQIQFQPILQTRVQYNLMKQTLGGLVKKIKDIDKKIKIITEDLTNYQKNKINNTIIQKIEDTIDQVFKSTIMGLCEQFETVKDKTQKMGEFYAAQYLKQQTLFQELNNKYQSLLKSSKNKKHGQSEQKYLQKQFKQDKTACNQNGSSFVGMTEKIVAMKQQIVQFQISLKSIPDIFKMYNTQYQQLFQKMKQIVSKGSSQNSNKIPQPINLQSLDIESKQPSHLESPTINSKTQYCIQSPKQQIRPVSMFKSNLTRSMSVFSLRDTLSVKNLENPYKVQKLIETFNILGHRTPVICKTDETGYLKYADSATYIFDNRGDIFELGQQEKDVAVNMGLIVFQS